MHFSAILLILLLHFKMHTYLIAFFKRKKNCCCCHLFFKQVTQSIPYRNLPDFSCIAALKSVQAFQGTTKILVFLPAMKTQLRRSRTPLKRFQKQRGVFPPSYIKKKQYQEELLRYDWLNILALTTFFYDILSMSCPKPTSHKLIFSLSDTARILDA